MHKVTSLCYDLILYSVLVYMEREEIVSFFMVFLLKTNQTLFLHTQNPFSCMVLNLQTKLFLNVSSCVGFVTTEIILIAEKQLACPEICKALSSNSDKPVISRTKGVKHF